MNKTYVIPKKYRYNIKHFGLNEGLDFLKQQIEYLNNENNKKKIKLFKQIKAKLEESNLTTTESKVIKNDLIRYLNEFSNAKEQLFREYNIVAKGSKGEDKIADIIYSFNDWEVIKNANFLVEGNKIENDFIVIDEGGISTIEVKNIGNRNEILIIDNLGRVTRKTKAGRKLETYDMLAQNIRHLAYLKKLIQNELPFEININPIIVIASDIRIKNESDVLILGPNQIFNAIKAFPKSLDAKQVLDAKELLLKNLVEESEYPYTDYLSTLTINQNFILKEIQEFIQNN